MKYIRIPDGLVVDFQMMRKLEGRFAHYWGTKAPGEYDLPPRGDASSRALCSCLEHLRQSPNLADVLKYSRVEGGKEKQ